MGPEFLARIHEQRTSVRAVETASNNNENHVRNDCNDAEMAEDLKPTYNVMTVDVSETYYPPIDDSSKSNRSTSTYIRVKAISDTLKQIGPSTFVNFTRPTQWT